MQADTGATLRRDILRFGVVLLVLNGIIGAGIFKLPARLAADAGGGSVWLIPLIGVLFLAVVLCFAELASRYDGSGGPVEYCGRAFGRWVSFEVGWMLFLSRMTAYAANTGVLLDYLGREIDVLRTPVGRGVGAIVVIGVLTTINVRGVRGAMRVLLGLSMFKVLPLCAMVVWGLTKFEPGLLEFAPVVDEPDLRRATITAVYAFVGFETVTMTAGETRDPSRSIPRALVWTLIATMLLYTGVQLAYLSVASDIDADPAAPLLSVGEAWLGGAGYYLLFIAAVTSLLGNLHTSAAGAPRLAYALAEQRQLPAVFARLHARFATPAACCVLYGVGGALFCLSGTFTELVAASSLSRTLVYLICAVAVLRLREVHGRAPFALPLGPVLPLLAIAICVWLTSLLQAETWLVLAAVVLLGHLLHRLARGARHGAGD